MIDENNYKIMKPKGKQSVRSAVEEVFNGMPRFHRFSTIGLTATVARMICRPQVFPDSCLRKLRELREEGKADFVCVSKLKSIYEKR
jgi:hypothetical protein